LRRTLVHYNYAHQNAIAVKVKQLAFELQKKYQFVVKKLNKQYTIFNKLWNVEECDATGDDRSNTDRNK